MFCINMIYGTRLVWANRYREEPEDWVKVYEWNISGLDALSNRIICYV